MTATAHIIFDRRLLRLRRERAARSLPGADFLVREVGERLAERLDDLRRSFAEVLVLGGHRGRLAEALAARPNVGRMTVIDPSPAMLEGCGGAATVVADEEALPFAADRFDLVASVQMLHWVNDLPGTLAQVRRSLKPDGLLLLALPGGETLGELRSALLEAELAEEGGAGPRVSPFVDLRDAGALLQRAGFALPVVDLDRIRVSYPDPLALLGDLRAMGETSALADGGRPLKRATLARAMALYAERHADAEGRVGATFDMLFLTAWKPHPSQQKPLRPGSGANSLAEAIGRGPSA